MSYEDDTKIELITHKYDIDKLNDIYLKRYNRVKEIKKIPQFEQKSKEWLNQRNECLTATAVSTALDEDPYKYPFELLLDKCGLGEIFKENENVHHGKKYEQIGTMFYGYRNNINVEEYGLIQHNENSYIGASPDGICDKYTPDEKMSKLVGRLLEIKFPKKRKIKSYGKLDGDICPHYYYRQVQTQLYVTELDECDFLQCEISEYDNWEEFIKDSHQNMFGLSKQTNLEKGCLIQLYPKNKINDKDCLFYSMYIYPPKMHMTKDEIEKWICYELINYPKNVYSKKYIIDKVIYWRLEKVSCNLIKAENFEELLPTLRQFWNYVLFYRKNIEKLKKLKEYADNIGIKNSKEIFERVQNEYKKVHKKSKYKPLYQEESEWRKIYNEKYKKYN